MATKLKNIELTSVDLVRQGANQEADICLYKSADAPEGVEQPVESSETVEKQTLEPQGETAVEATGEPQDDILEVYKTAITKSIQSIMTDDNLSAEEKDAMVEKSLGQYHNKLEEVLKFNPYHDSRGRFTSGGGGGGAVTGAGTQSLVGTSVPNDGKSLKNAVARATGEKIGDGDTKHLGNFKFKVGDYEVQTEPDDEMENLKITSISGGKSANKNPAVKIQSLAGKKVDMDSASVKNAVERATGEKFSDKDVKYVGNMRYHVGDYEIRTAIDGKNQDKLRITNAFNRKQLEGQTNASTQKSLDKSDRYDEIVHVEKFNPFHDAAGKFSSSHGFKTYSANPNTKAGAMAIARSAAAGHGNTMNVHRQSYGENIRQNANWLGQGKQASPRQQGNTTLRSRVEPIAGLAGASATGASWQAQNAMQGKQTQPGKYMQQKQQQAQQTQNQQQQSQPQKQTASKPAQQQAQQQQNQQAQQQAQQQQAQTANNRKPVDGKDISSTFRYNHLADGDPLNQVAKLQGYSEKPTLIKDSTEFSNAVKASGIMAYRTIAEAKDVVNGKFKTGQKFADDLKNSDTFVHNGNGYRAYGSGMYMAAAYNTAGKGTAPSRSDTNSAKRDSIGYGKGKATDKTLAITLDPSAKIGDYNQICSEYSRLTFAEKQRFGNDLGAYAASKGLDGLKAANAGYGCDYITVYNRSKLIIFDN